MRIARSTLTQGISFAGFPPGRLRLAGLFTGMLFLGAAFSYSSCAKNQGSRTGFLKERNKLRAYHGAPPRVPHQLDEIGRTNCLSCHQEGNALKYNRRAPVTPHPERVNCRQCHVPIAVTTTFTESNYKPYRRRSGARPSQPLGPPYIPHRLQDRENCRACHLSVSTPPILRPRHGERTNCTQCHVPQSAVAAFPANPEKKK